MGFVRAWLSPFLACCLVVAPSTSVRGAERNVVVLAAKSPPASEPRIALVIGNADYPQATLANPVNDARALAERLTALRFRVTRLENATQDQMYEAIRAFGDQLRGGGVGLFYYAGHALQVRGRNYLLPARAKIEREDEILYRTVDTGQILDKMENARNRINIVILDACRNNPFGRDFRSVSPGLAVVDAPANTMIAFATAPGAVASDGGGLNGLYTQHLLQALADPGLGLEDVFKKVRAGVRRDSAGRQVPWESTSLEVDFFFDPPASAAAPPVAAAPDPLTLELAFWDSVKGSSDPEDYRAYLQRYPGGQFAVLAGNRLRTMTAPVPAPALPVASIPSEPSPALAIPNLTPVAPSSTAPVRPSAQAAPPPQMALATPTVMPTVAPPISVALPSAPVATPLPVPSAQEAASAPAPPRTLQGHTGAVLAVAVSRSGTQALSGAADRGLRLWDLPTGRELRRFRADTGAVTATAIAPDGRLFLSGGADRRVRLWDASSGTEFVHMNGHAAGVTAVAFGPTGRYAVSAAEDGEVMLWELPAGKLIRRGRASDSGVRSLALSADGRFLLTASQDGVVRLWAVDSLSVQRSFGPLTAPAVAAGFGDTARRISAVDARGELWSWDAKGGALLGRLDTGSTSPVLGSIAGDGATALIAGADGRMALWDIASGRVLWRAGASPQRVTAVALGPRGTTGTIGLSAGDDMRLQLWTIGLTPSKETP